MLSSFALFEWWWTLPFVLTGTVYFVLAAYMELHRIRELRGLHKLVRVLGQRQRQNPPGYDA